jgi:membrane protein implicated in regulation of membrane protease activity
MRDFFNKLFSNKPILKKVVGVCFVVIGVVALVTPFTPGSWLVFIGFEFLGFRFLVWSKAKAWYVKRYGKNTTPHDVKIDRS